MRALSNPEGQSQPLTFPEKEGIRAVALTSGRGIRVKTMGDIIEEATKAEDSAWAAQVGTMVAMAKPTYLRTSYVRDARSPGITSETAPRTATHFTTRYSARVSLRLNCG